MGGSTSSFAIPVFPLVGNLGPGVDVKSNGYVVVAPSEHPDGGLYAWAHSPFETAIADLPVEWALAVIKNEPKSKPTGKSAQEVINDSEAPLDFDGSSTVITDAEGKVISGTRCEVQGAVPPVVIRQGEHVRIRCGFPVNFGDKSWYCCNPDFRLITLRQPGFSQAGREIIIRGTMRWNE
jgi:hypothetical protein